MIVPPWVRPLIAVGALAASFIAGHHYASIKADNASLRASEGRRGALDAAIDKERDRADQYSQQVIDLLQATPPVTNTIRETIRENPSTCVRPTPVTDGLHQALSRANQAIAAAGGNGALPADAGEASKPDGR